MHCLCVAFIVLDFHSFPSSFPSFSYDIDQAQRELLSRIFNSNKKQAKSALEIIYSRKYAIPTKSKVIPQQQQQENPYFYISQHLLVWLLHAVAAHHFR